MKLVKSLLLGSAAGLAAVAGAQAADLPAKKAAPVEYVRVCSTYGAGFFYIPGTEGCLRVSGQVRADYQYTERFTRADDTIGFYARGRVQLDHRQATAYGLLRTFVRMEIARGSGSRSGGGLAVAGASGVSNGVGVGPNIAQAFIQFGGLTAGRVTSFFDNADLPMTQMIGLFTSESPETQLLAYTFSFGGGFSATVSLEDPRERSVGFRGASNLPGFTLIDGRETFDVVQGGYTVPDVVANVKYNGTWGGFQLSGALHQVRDAGAVATVANPLGGRLIGPAGGPFVRDAYADSEIGFAVRADAYVKLDALSPGDTAWIAATYTDGAPGYISSGASFTAGLASFNVSEGIINPYNGNIATTKAWSIAAGFTHYWMPTLRTGVFGSYASFDNPGFASTVVTDATGGLLGANVGLVDGTAWRVGANTFWTPVSGLDIGVEVIYTKVDPRGVIAATTLGGVRTNTVYSGSDDAFAGRLRIQRTF